jgi:hypothetical protein
MAQHLKCYTWLSFKIWIIRVRLLAQNFRLNLKFSILVDWYFIILNQTDLLMNFGIEVSLRSQSNSSLKISFTNYKLILSPLYFLMVLERTLPLLR